MKVWFYSDPHYAHANIIKHAERPFRNVTHMDHELERRYLSTVGDDDLVVWCGDCFWTGFDGAGLLARLPGRKVLVRGNHDSTTAKMLDLGFEAVSEKFATVIGGVNCLVNHYPPAQAAYVGREHDSRYQDLRPILGKDWVVIHGHTHEKVRSAPGRVHVGVDAWGYAPAPMEEVEQLVRAAKRG